MEENLQQQLLPKTRRALRIMTATLYDEELLLYIDTVLHDFRTLGLNTEEVSPLLETACIYYAKSAFGTGGTEDKEAWHQMYETLKRQALIRGE